MTASPLDDVRKLLEQQMPNARALLAAMREEHEALLARDARRIEEALAQKSAFLGVFEKLELERTELFKLAGLPAARGLATDKLRDLAVSGQPDLVEMWGELLELAGQCRRQNEANGALVEASRRHVERALDLLHGDQGHTPTYRADGATARGSASRPIAKA